MKPQNSGRRRVKRHSWTDDWNNSKLIVAKTLQEEAKPEYVAWIDLMGAKSWMAGSIRRAAEMVGLIHLTGIRTTHAYDVRAYPVIDGVYLVGEHKTDFRRATAAVMRHLALEFTARASENRFLVRGGIAYGRVLHGESIAKLHEDLSDNKTYSKCLALGVSIGQAYSAEGKAPPFGYFVDITARSTASGAHSPYTSSFYRWWSLSREAEVAIATKFGSTVNDHYDYLRGKHREIEYSLERLEEHQRMVREYFHLKQGSDRPS